jgi:hypothetical protein
LAAALERVNQRKVRDMAAADKNYNDFLSQSHKGRWANEMLAAHDALKEEYAELNAAGVADPFVGRDHGSIAFREKVSNFRTKKAQAEYLDKHLDDMGKLHGAGVPGTYSDESIARAFAPIGRSFDELLDTEVAFLEKQTPLADLGKVIGVFAERFGQLPTVSDMVKGSQEFVQTAPPDVARALKESYDKLPANKKIELQKSASRSGMDDVFGVGALSAWAMELTQQQLEPFDFTKFKDKLLDFDPISYSSDTYSSYTSPREVRATLIQRGMDELAAKPGLRNSDELRAAIKADDDDTDADFEAKYKAWLSERAKEVGNQGASKRAPKAAPGGNDDDKVEASLTNWWTALNSPDVDVRANAIRFLDKEEMKEVVPGMADDEVIQDVGMRPDGIMTVSTDQSTYEVDIHARREAINNAYSRTAKGSKRYFGTTETGRAVQPQTVVTKDTADDL